MRFKKPRAFKRDESLSIRLPEGDKDRLRQLARAKRRDTSNLALEFIVNGIVAMEAQVQSTSAAENQSQ
jgi:predicted transcriptional regulator